MILLLEISDITQKVQEECDCDANSLTYWYLQDSNRECKHEQPEGRPPFWIWVYYLGPGAVYNCKEQLNHCSVKKKGID